MPTILEQLIAELKGEKAGGFKVTASGTPSTNLIHGPGGIFGVQGLEQDLISTRVQPRGLAGTLAAKNSIRMEPLFAYLSGFKDTVGDDPDGVCDNCPTAGEAKSCIQTAQFGRYCYKSKELDLSSVGVQLDRGEFLDLRFVNDPLLQQIGGMLNMNIAGTPNLAREVLMAWVSVGVAFQNKLIRQVYVGNPANNTANGGYKEFPGLDILIGTNKVDALTGIACPSLNSDIKDFEYDEIGGAGKDIVHYMTYMFRFLRHNATRMNFDPVQWVIAMRPELFYELTAIWPCSYLSYRCTSSGTNFGQVDMTRAVEFRDQMRQGSYLLIDGIKVPVVEDDGITEEDSDDNQNIDAGNFASDIYFIPISVKGGYMTTYWEYKDYSAGMMPAVGDGKLGQHYWTDGGRFAWTYGVKNWCAIWESLIEPRIILRTPQLAGRIQNVQYAPLQHFRSPFPDDDNFANGGETSREVPEKYSDWNMPGS